MHGVFSIGIQRWLHSHYQVLRLPQYTQRDCNKTSISPGGAYENHRFTKILHLGIFF